MIKLQFQLDCQEMNISDTCSLQNDCTDTVLQTVHPQCNCNNVPQLEDHLDLQLHTRVHPVCYQHTGTECLYRPRS